jgi:hypothetical protein
MSSKNRRYLSIFLLGFYSTLVAARIVKVPKTEKPPVIDGTLDDSAWQNASVFTEFRTIRPDFGLPPSERTEVYMLYDADKLYLGFRCFDSEPEKIKASVTRRDNPGNDDWIAFCLDTFHDELGAYFFGVNPFGIQMDGTLNADADPDITLDMVWSSAGRLTPEGYSAEIAIPFASLRFPSKENIVMGFKAARNISRKSEEVDFPEYHPERGAALAQFQKIELDGIETKQLLEVLPATTVNQKHIHRNGAMFMPGTESDFSLTTKFGITSGLVADATVNPDFSQVETDAGQIDVNLRHALYYPERRPFFLEGQEHFAFGARRDNMPLGAVVHTRSIVDPVLGLKFTGKIGRDNILSAIYAQDEHPKKAGSNENGQAPGGGNAHISILRYIRKLRNDSFLGGFFTARRLAENCNVVIGSDGRVRLSNHSFFEYYGFASLTEEKESTDPRIGNAVSAVYTYRSRRLNAEIGFIELSQNFHTDVGYLTRRGVTFLPFNVEYNFYPKLSWLQRITPYCWARYGRDKASGLYETFNVVGLSVGMPRQTSVGIAGWLANEVFQHSRFSRNTFRVEGESQVMKHLFLRFDVRTGKQIYYDAVEPYQGWAHRAEFSIVFQPTGNVSTGLDITTEAFYRSSDDEKIYDYTIYRNRTVLQLNRYLFLRSVLECNTHSKHINADFLISYTYIPGTVVYIGYGSVHEKLEWQNREYIPSDNFLLTKKTLFFKASYLWRF